MQVISLESSPSILNSEIAKAQQLRTAKSHTLILGETRPLINQPEVIGEASYSYQPLDLDVDVEYVITPPSFNTLGNTAL